MRDSLDRIVRSAGSVPAKPLENSVGSSLGAIHMQWFQRRRLQNFILSVVEKQ